MADFTHAKLQPLTTQSDQSIRLKQTSVVFILRTMFSSVDHGDGSPLDYNFSNLKPSQSTPIDGEKTPQHVIGNGRRPVYGLQYPRGYYNK